MLKPVSAQMIVDAPGNLRNPIKPARRGVYVQIKNLQAAAADRIVMRNPLAVDATAFECDCYGFNRGDVQAINMYNGKYMADYNWGGFTLGWLHNKQQ